MAGRAVGRPGGGRGFAQRRPMPAPAPARRLPLPLTFDLRRAAGFLSLAGVTVTGCLVAVGVAGEPSSFVPGRKGGYPGWLHEPLSSLDIGLSTHLVVFAMLAMRLFYGL